MSDPEDLLSDSLQTLYDHAPIAHSSAGSLFDYIPSGEPCTHSSTTSVAPITLKTPDTQPANWSLHATSIWASSLFMADHLAQLHIDRHIQSVADRGEPLHVLELGAGAGLPGILIAQCYDQARVVSSDYPDAELIRTLTNNVERNTVFERCRVQPYAWGSDPTFLFGAYRDFTSENIDGFDVVIAADTLWNPDLHPSFLQTLRLTLRKSMHARIYLVAGLHTGRYTIEAFLRALPTVGLEPEELTEKEVRGTRCRPWSADREETEQDRRRWVVWMELRWVS